MPIRGYKALVKAQSSAVAMTNEATTMSGGDTIYTITNAAKRTLDIDTPVIVKVGGSAVTTGFAIDYLSGVIIFATAASRTFIAVGVTSVPIPSPMIYPSSGESGMIH